jgi:hypothetical protein
MARCGLDSVDGRDCQGIQKEEHGPSVRLAHLDCLPRLKKSRSPDKNPNDKTIHERFARLGVVSTILRNKESRDRSFVVSALQLSSSNFNARYDFFYKNGVPTWRGTGYYYSRFRPGLGVCFGSLVGSEPR